VAFSGRLTFLAALFDAHGTVTGRPFTEGVTENMQLVAFLTEAVSVTAPPAGVSVFGVGVNDEIEGAAKTFAMTGLAVVAPPDPLALKEKV
jgi:hypothetical protein